MAKTAFYRIDFQHHSSTSLAFDEMHATEIVEAPENISYSELSELCRNNIPGFWHLNNFKKTYVRKLA